MDIDALADTYAMPRSLCAAAIAVGERLGGTAEPDAPLIRVGDQVDVATQPEVTAALATIRVPLEPRVREDLEHLATEAWAVARCRRGIRVCGILLTSQDASAHTVAMEILTRPSELVADPPALLEDLALADTAITSDVTASSDAWTGVLRSTVCSR